MKTQITKELLAERCNRKFWTLDQAINHKGNCSISWGIQNALQGAKWGDKKNVTKGTLCERNRKNNIFPIKYY